jgi:dephospho-CoA kinase
MLRVGLTGGICTGKSTVGQAFAEFGCHFIESDSIGHQLFKPGEPVYAAVVTAFGSGILAEDGTINRKALGNIVFHDTARLQELNKLVHPEIIRRQKKWLDELEAADPNSVGIIESALMIEVGTYKNYDRVIVVLCSAQEQLRRLQVRSGLSEDEARARIESQMPLQEKARYADYLIDTSGTFEQTRTQVQSVSSTLRELAAGSSGRPRS